MPLNGLFTGALAGAIDAERRRCLIRRIGTASLPIEHEIRRHMNEARTMRGCRRGQCARTCLVDAVGHVDIGFSAVDRCISRRIDDEIRRKLCNESEHRILVGDIQFSARQGHQIRMGRGRALQGMAKLAICARDHHFHGKVTASANGLPAMSLAESCGSMPSSGHSISNAGSFQSRLCSFDGS